MDDTHTQRAARMAVGIEAAMDVAHDHKQQTKAYGDKARSLKYNLDTNEHLRFRVVVGQIDPVTLGAFLFFLGFGQMSCRICWS